MPAAASGACPRPLVAFGTLVWATLFVLPFGLADASMLGWEALLSVLYLGVAATGAAYLLYFGLIAGAGASKAVLVTYLVPSLALVYGAVFLDETVTALSLVGLALVLTGVALGTGTVPKSEPVLAAAASTSPPSGARPTSSSRSRSRTSRRRR